MATNEKYKLIDGTSKIELVKVKQFVKSLLRNNTRGYNFHEIEFYEHYMSLSAPLTEGYHDTLVLTRQECENHFEYRKTMREYYADVLEQFYLPIFEEFIKDKTALYIKEKIKEILKG